MYNILLVEDEASIRENIQEGILWESYGFHIEKVASNGEQALEILEKVHPDILLTDIRMPFMDGLELSRIVKRLFPDMKIVILSGYMEFAYAKEAISIGVEEYVVKPITPAKVIRTFTALKEKMDEEVRKSEAYNSLVSSVKNMENKLENNPDQKIGPGDLVYEANRDNKLQEFLQTGSLSDINRFLDSFFQGGDDHLLNSLIFGAYFYVHCIVTCIKEVQLLGGDPEKVFSKIENVEEYVASFSTPERARQEIEDIIATSLKYRDQAVDRSYSVIEKACLFINEHYTEPKLVIGDVASAVGLSASHFSFVFKQKMGCSFIKYLTSIRIEKAKELLRTTSLSAAVIADKVGYSDPNYFSMVFHKAVKLTPTEYRNP